MAPVVLNACSKKILLNQNVMRRLVSDVIEGSSVGRVFDEVQGLLGVMVHETEVVATKDAATLTPLGDIAGPVAQPLLWDPSARLPL